MNVKSLFICLFLTTFTHARCPRKCVCSGFRVRCNGLEDIPNNLPINTTHLDLSNNQIKRLTFQKIGSLDKLQNLNISFNHLNTIDPASLSNCPRLLTLDLSHNHLISLPTDLVKWLYSLKHLNLSYNSISFDTPYDERDIRCKLDYLDLSYNNLQDLNDGINHLFHTVRHFFLNGNNIKNLQYENLSTFVEKFKDRYHSSMYIEDNQATIHIQSRFFENVFWKKFSLKGSKIKDVSLLSGLRAEVIDLSDNPLDMNTFTFTDVTAITCKSLYLRNIGVSSIKNYPFRNFKQLKRLDLSGNQLKVLDEQVSVNMTSLEYFDLSNNHLLKDISIKFALELKLLKSLNLSHCSLKHINLFAFSSFTFLQNLDLSHNKLEFIPKEMSVVFKSLKHLNLSHNRLHCNCKMKWLQQWLAQTTLNLQDENAILCESPRRTSLQNAEFLCYKPTIISSSRNIKAFEGERLEHRCEVEADPLASIDIILPSGAHHRKSSSTFLRQTRRTQTVVTKKVVAETQGVYTCVASNEMGEATTKWVVTFLASPKSNLNIAPSANNTNRADDFDLGFEISPKKPNTTTTKTTTFISTTFTTTAFPIIYPASTTLTTTSTPSTTPFPIPPSTFLSSSTTIKISTTPTRKTTISTTTTSTKTTISTTTTSTKTTISTTTTSTKTTISTKKPRKTKTTTPISYSIITTTTTKLEETLKLVNTQTKQQQKIQETPASLDPSVTIHPFSDQNSTINTTLSRGILSSKENRLAASLAAGVILILLLLLCAIFVVVLLRKRHKRKMYLMEKRSALLRTYPRSGSYDRRNRSNGGMINTPATQDKPQNGFNMLLAKEQGTL